MPKPKIKVCGITSLEDALSIEALGVEYLGFNFIKTSKRYITPEAAGEIIKKLSRAIPVGIFMDQEESYIQNCIDISTIQIAQLHGNESPEFSASISIPVIKVFSIELNFDASLLSQFTTDYFLFDAQSGNERGGTGKAFDWTLIQNISKETPYFLAGGLGPHNIQKAVQQTTPFALDLNSKIELSPGKKDISALKSCIELLEIC